MFFPIISLMSALLLAEAAIGAESSARRACYDETAALHCYSGEFDVPQEVDAADVTFVAAYLRAYGRETRTGRLLTMTSQTAPDCGEWSLYARRTAMAVAKKINITYDSAVLFEDVANTIDGGTGAIRRSGIYRCATDGGSLGVQVNTTAAAYSLPAYVNAGYKPDGIIVKIVANL